MKRITIDDIIKERGFERGVVYVLHRFSEEFVGYQQALRELATQLDRVVMIVNNMTNVAMEMKSAVEKIKSITGGNTGVTLSGEGTED